MSTKEAKHKKNLEIDPMDSECEDDETAIYKTEARKVSEKQQEIDELNKRLRYVELEFKKKEIEMSAELGNERTRANELQDILTNELNKLKANREANELQERLVLVENELFEKQQIAHEILHQLTQIELENEQLKAELDRSKSSQSAATNPVNSQSSSSPFKHPGDLDVEQLVTRCLDLEREKQELQKEVGQIRDGAIDAIVEKEKIILTLQETLEQQQQLLLQHHSITSLNDLNSIRGATAVATSNPEALAEAQFHEGMERLRSEYESEISLLSARCEELQLRFDTEQSYHEEQMHALDASISQRVYENIQSHIDSAKNNEADLLQQLSLVDERAKTQERLLVEAQKQLAQIRDELRREKEVADAKITRLSKQCDNFEEVSKTSRALSKELDETKKLADKELADKQIALEKLTMKRDDLLKITVNLEADNKRLKENSGHLKSTILSLESSVESLYAQLDQAQLESQVALKAAHHRFETEKSTLYDELHFLKHKSNGIYSDKDISEQEHPQVNSKNVASPNEHQQNLHPSTPKKTIETEAGLLNDMVSSEKISKNSHNAAVLKSTNEDINDRSGLKPQEQLSTLLGLEFGDEDFNIEEGNSEEEKTDSSSMISSTTSPSKNQLLSFKSPSQHNHSIHASNESIRNNFKNQFRVGSPEAPAAATVTANTSLCGSICQENAQLVLELKAKLSKYECTINSYETRIERVQNESKAMLTQLQEARREKVQSNKEAELIEELNSFKTHCHSVETQFVTQKLQLTEDLHFFKNELRILEKQNIEFRNSLAIETSEGASYKAKYTKLKGILKHRRTGGGLASLGSESIAEMNLKAATASKAQQQPAAMSSFSNSPFNSPTSQMIRQHAAQQQQSSTQQPSGHAKKKSFWIFK